MSIRPLSLLIVALAGCHLAADPDPPTCAEGSHVEKQRCVADDRAKFLASIGAGCTITPAELTVAVGVNFQFVNDDDVRHLVTGIGGQLSEDIPPGEASRFIAVARAGRYSYDVSGCPSGGVIVVE